MSRLILVWMFSLVVATSPSFAQTRIQDVLHPSDPRGEPEITVCSQNLKNYGSLADVMRRESRMSKQKLHDKEIALLKRFLDTKCDVIAVQELLGATQDIAKASLERLARMLQFRSGRSFKVYAAPSNDKIARNAFLVAEDRVEVTNVLSYARVELPKIAAGQRPRLFVRGPYELQLMTKPREGSESKHMTLVNFHFKSRAYNSRDPAELEWETYRMEMAEALRRIIVNRHKAAFASGEDILVLLGDRNSNFDVASAKILSGRLTLKHFQEEAPCRVNERGVPLCAVGVPLAEQFVSLLTGDTRLRMLPGTYTYQKTFSWLDEILVPVESLGFAAETPGTEGKYTAGVLYEPEEASDHALVYARFNW